MHESNEWIIWDLDNCIADDRPRIPLIDWSKYPSDECWELYHKAAGNDPVGNAQRFNELHGPRAWLRVGKASPRPLFVTARPERYREAAEEWIFRNLSWGLRDADGPVMHLLMRKDGDKRRSVELKRDAVRAWLDQRPDQRIVGAFDDQPDVISMYFDQFSIRGEVLRIHGIETHRPPEPLVRRVDTTCDADIMSLEDLRPMKERDWAALRAEKPRRVTADSVLDEMAALFRERNGAYKDNYKMVAPIMRTLFPDGVPPELVLDDRWHLFELAVVKLTRFAISGLNHSDSARDAAVYLAMIDAINKERQ